ncbi:MAG TPA: hypothetical protein PK530_19870 [Anaerolineales bacterium]|nr:hypothetical protein [Anaerolineales bacterium]
MNQSQFTSMICGIFLTVSNGVIFPNVLPVIQEPGIPDCHLNQGILKINQSCKTLKPLNLNLSRLISITLTQETEPCLTRKFCLVTIHIKNISGKSLEIIDPEVALFLDVDQGQFSKTGQIFPQGCYAPMDLTNVAPTHPGPVLQKLVLKRNEKIQRTIDLSRLSWAPIRHGSDWPNKKFSDLVSTGPHRLQLLISKPVQESKDANGQTTYHLEKTRVSSNQISIEVTE